MEPPTPCPPPSRNGVALPIPQGAHPRRKVDLPIRSLPIARLVRQNGPARPAAPRAEAQSGPPRKPALNGRLLPPDRCLNATPRLDVRTQALPRLGQWFRQNPAESSARQASLRQRPPGRPAAGHARRRPPPPPFLTLGRDLAPPLRARALGTVSGRGLTNLALRAPPAGRCSPSAVDLPVPPGPVFLAWFPAPCGPQLSPPHRGGLGGERQGK